MVSKVGNKYKKIVTIPEGWEVNKIGDFAREIKLKNKEAENYEVLSVTKYDGIVSSLEYFKKQVYSKDTSNYKIIKKNQFAYSTIHLDEGSLGLLEEFNSGVISPMYTVFETNNSINKKFLFILMKSDLYIKRYSSLGQGSINRRMSIPFKTLATLLIHSPPLNEQHKIVTILNSVDETIKKTEMIINQTEKVKKGLMQQILTKGIGHTNFKETEIGEIPEEWEIKELEEISRVSGGKRLPKGKSLVDTDTGHPYIRVSDMSIKGISLSNIQYVPLDVVDTIKRYRIKAGDLYISVAGTLGVVGIVPKELDEANLTENADRISEVKCNNDFLLYVLQSELIQSIIKRQSTTSAQPKLALTRIKKFLVPLPPLDEQMKISMIIKKIYDKISIEEQKLSKLKLIKKGLMQALLTGKVRVKIDE